jgi:hypothetical protein
MERVWRTLDGRYVRDGHPDAAFLVSAEADERPADFVDFVDFDDVDKPKAAKKASAKVTAEPIAKHEA